MYVHGRTTLGGGVARRLGLFVTETKGATAVEFALVSVLLISFVLFILYVGLVLYLREALDYATQKAARQVMTGAVQKANLTQDNFRTNIVCKYLPAAMSCSNVIVNLYTVTYGAQPSGYYAYTNGTNASDLTIPALSNASAQYQPGIQSSYEYLLVVYPVTGFPSLFSKFLGLTTYNGAPAYPLITTAAFRNEQY